MATSRLSRTFSAGALVAAVALAGSAHAAVYSSEGFEAGTPNYTINGVNSGASADSWLKLTDGSGNVEPVEALAGTDYDPAATSRVGVVANSEPTHFTPGGTIPTGQHGFVSTSQNRRLISNYAMPLVTDGVTSLDISLSTMFFALENNGTPITAKGTAIILYSALGDFSDEVQLLSFGIGQPGSWVETPDHPVVANTWDSSVSVSITNGMSANSFTDQASGFTTPSTVVFTDTAKLRINRIPMNTSGVLYVAESDTPTNHITFLDDIIVEGVISGPALPGDTDGDGDVDDSDLGTSFSNYTGPVGDVGKTAAQGDNDGDGDVDDSDLGTSFSNYTGPIAASVPEPASLALLGLGGLLAVRRRRA